MYLFQLANEQVIYIKCYEMYIRYLYLSLVLLLENNLIYTILCDLYKHFYKLYTPFDIDL